MKIAVIGTQKQIEELSSIVGSENSLEEVKNNDFESYSLLFDLAFDNDPSRLEIYSRLKETTVVLSCAKIQLESILAQKSLIEKSQHIFGINALPTFLNRDKIEMCKHHSEQDFSSITRELNWDIIWVKSRVGLVTPRVICMIINEAYYTVQEGTATKEDIDIGMKLGTAYPMGPFEWCEKIGIRNVHDLLKAVYEDTQDPRYMICPMLKTEMLKSVTLS